MHRGALCACCGALGPEHRCCSGHDGVHLLPKRPRRTEALRAMFKRAPMPRCRKEAARFSIFKHASRQYLIRRRELFTCESPRSAKPFALPTLAPARLYGLVQFSRLDSGQVALHGFVPGLSRCGQQCGRRDSGKVSGIHTQISIALHSRTAQRCRDRNRTVQEARHIVPRAPTAGHPRQVRRALSGVSPTLTDRHVCSMSRCICSVLLPTSSGASFYFTSRIAAIVCSPGFLPPSASERAFGHAFDAPDRIWPQREGYRQASIRKVIGELDQQ